MDLQEFNKLSLEAQLSLVGFIFEHSPWISERAIAKQKNGAPFKSVEEFHSLCCLVVDEAGPEERLKLLREHPDLVGKTYLSGELSASSTAEQATFGKLTEQEIQFFQTHNEQYKKKFDFPFIICVRLNKKEAIMEALPKRLLNTREEELKTAVDNVKQIALLRLNGVLKNPDAKL